MIKFRNVTVRRQGTHILDSINLDIGLGTHTAVIGQNGAGKSTLIKLISKDIHPLALPDMELSLFGKKRWHIFELKSRIGIISEQLQNICRTTYTVRETIISGFFSSIGLDRFHQVTEEMERKSAERAQFMEIFHLYDKQMDRLSSGEARRVLIARALVHDPESLVLDEPSNSLDLKAQAEFKHTLRKIAAEQRHIVLVTHDLADIIPEIEHVIIMKHGKIFSKGSKHELLTEKILSDAFETKVYVDHRDGWFKAWC